MNKSTDVEYLTDKVDILERAIYEIQELISNSAGIYWDVKRQGTRQVGNLSMNRWHELDEDLIHFHIAKEFLDNEREET